MKALKNTNVSFLFLAMLTFGCQDESIPQDCAGDNAQYIETFYSEEFASTPCTLQSIDNDKKEVNLIITTQADFEKYFNCTAQLPLIDFDKYLILTGTYRHHQCAEFDSQSISVCNNKIIYEVQMVEQICQAALPVFFVLVIDKKFSTFPVVFDVHFQN